MPASHVVNDCRYFFSRVPLALNRLQVNFTPYIRKLHFFLLRTRLYDAIVAVDSRVVRYSNQYTIHLSEYRNTRRYHTQCEAKKFVRDRSHGAIPAEVRYLRGGCEKRPLRSEEITHRVQTEKLLSVGSRVGVRRERGASRKINKSWHL